MCGISWLLKWLSLLRETHPVSWHTENAVHLYLGGVQFESQLGHWLCYGCFVVFHSSLRIVSQLGHRNLQYLSGPLLICHQHYILWHTGNGLSKPQIKHSSTCYLMMLSVYKIISHQSLLNGWVWSICGMIQGNLSSQSRIFSSATLFTTNPTWTDLELNPDLLSHCITIQSM